MADDFSNKILIFSDGACSGNPGSGGFGTIVVLPSGQVEELGAGFPNTTNNRMELVGVIRGLEKIKKVPGAVWVLTDSTYVIRGITQWIWGWRKRGWKTAEGQDVSNRDLWEVLSEEVLARKRHGQVDWKYLRGHQGTPGNERCDEIAVAFTKNKNPSLYKGSLLNYAFAIYDLPEDLSLPPEKPRNEKKPEAFSYLSYVNGSLARHSSWGDCEARVKGRPGAKFKKALSAADEVTIVTGWGIDPSSLSKLDED